MFSENNITTNYPRELAHCTTMLIDLSLGERLQILGERRVGMYKCDTKLAISETKQSRAKVTAECL